MIKFSCNTRRAAAVGLLALASLPLALQGRAEGYRTIYAKMTDGSKVGVTLAENLSVGIKGEGQVMAFMYEDPETGQRVDALTVRSTKFAGLELSQDVSGVETVADYTVTPLISDGVLRISGLQHPVNVMVCDLSGKVLEQRVIDADTALSLRAYGAGMYLVSIDGVTYKMLVK